MQQQLAKNICEIYNCDGITKQQYTDISVVCTTRKYTSTKSPIWRLVIDGEETTRKSPLLVKYKCLTCECISTVSMLSFLRKLNNSNAHMCYMCRNKCEQKRENHSVWMTGKNIRSFTSSPKIHISATTLYEQAKESFSNLPLDFQNEYWKKHLKHYQMVKLLSFIRSLHNGHIPLDRIKRCEYWEVYPCGNQMQFTPVFYDAIDNEVIRIYQPILRCEQCDSDWRCKNMKPFVDCYRVLCPSCKLCRRTFKIRGTSNLNCEKILYQSKPEKQFIDWCKTHNIVVKNGPQIQYTFRSKDKKYKVDFLIPSIGYLVEVKDDHCWHRNQVDSGQWTCKEQAVLDMISQGYYEKFLLLTPKTKANCLQEILARISKI